MAEMRDWRAWINKHGTIVGAVAIGVAVLVIVWQISGRGPHVPPPVTKVFFVDEVTGEVVVEPVGAIPPLPGKDGKPTLVRAVFYTLGTDDQKQLAYMEKYTEAGRTAMEASATQPGFMGDSPQTLVRSPEPGSKWVPQFSEAGQKITGVLNEVAGKPGFRFVMPK